MRGQINLRGERGKMDTLDPRALRRERWELGSEIWAARTVLTLRSALEMTRSARAVEARTPARTTRRSAAMRRRGAGVVAIFPRPDRVGELGFAAEM